MCILKQEEAYKSKFTVKMTCTVYITGYKWRRGGSVLAAERDYRETSVISAPLKAADGQYMWTLSVLQLTAEPVWVEAALQGNI